MQSNVKLPTGLAVGGMVCGILSLVLFWVPILGLILNKYKYHFYFPAHLD